MSQHPPHLRDRAAARLRRAAYERLPCQPVRDLLGSDDVDAAYAVQAANTWHACELGRHRIGRKVGLTSSAVRRQLGVHQPDLGTLLDDALVPSAGRVDPGRLLQPRIEAEVAFVLGRDLDATTADVEQVRDAVEYAVAALEICDSRIAGWDISITDTVADNASAGLFVLGPDRVDISDLDLSAVTMTMHRNGTQVASGSGADCLDDPLNALRWLANAALTYGEPLQAGEIVLSGALGPMVPVTAGDEVAATISAVGSVAVSIGSAEEVHTHG
ncbi:2-keto-4-pentenoate hydratase [Micromonospora sp. LOL_015]|uniref:2-keto-4-pentenoate hydratase n=1 Tax=Micromonospora sp. LOL_015 TaxID=3345416 RepID=UPI003A8AA812